MKLGFKHSVETRRKMSESAKKRGPNPVTIETRRKMSESAKGKKLTFETRRKIAEANKRRSPPSLVTRRKMSEAQKGTKHWRWKGGVTPRNRHSIEYSEWRRRVFKRDNYTCQKCGERDSDFHVHHIIPWSDAPAKRYEIENGITLCIPCHKKLHRDEKEKAA